MTTSSMEQDEILGYLRNLESRISRIENHLNIGSLDSEEIKMPPLFKSKAPDSADKLELQIGQFWFAKAGIVILSIGIAFLLTFPYKNLPPYFPSLIGFVLVGGILSVSHISRKSFGYISGFLLGGGLLLLYFTVMRLYYFGDVNVITNRPFIIMLLLLVAIVNVVIGFKKDSVYLFLIGILLVLATGFISDTTWFILPLLLIISILITFLKIKKEWNFIFLVGIPLVYFSHLIWFLNNPLLGNKLQLVTTPYVNIYFVLLYALIFSFGNLFRHDKTEEKNTVILSSLLNGLLAYGLILFLTLAKFNENLPLPHLITSAVYISIAIVFWLNVKSKYSTFLYAMFGYTAMSVAIIAQFENPEFFIWLSWQSLLVISTAIWFRSKFIIVANFLIFIVIFLAYLIMANSISLIVISFGVVALVSARILNWKQDRLELKTELMRNSYLVVAFIIFPYALYHLVPTDYISLSWIGISFFYYVISVYLKNNKYRWMALYTLALTVIYIVLVGTVNLEPIYRIISFMLLGIVLLIISFVYARKKLKTEKSDEGSN